MCENITKTACLSSTKGLDKHFHGFHMDERISAFAALQQQADGHIYAAKQRFCMGNLQFC
jgi:hypothetical protein